MIHKPAASGKSKPTFIGRYPWCLHSWVFRWKQQRLYSEIGLKKSLNNITFLSVWCHVNERMKPDDNINGQKWPHLSSYWARVPAAGRLKITIISLWLFYHLLQPQPVMLINNRYKDKLLRLKGEEQINNEHWASVLSGGLERDQVQIMIKVTVIDSKQVTTERRAALPYVSSSPS